MPEIKIDSLTVAYGEKKVLEDFSHSFAPGSFTSVLGPSGSGKTSLVNAIMGLIPYSGSIKFSAPPLFSAVFQEDRLCEGLTALRNVSLTASGTFSKQEILSAFDSVGLNGCALRRAHSLSGGMKRRTAILRALMAEYNILILDEPFKGLDPDTKLLTMSYVKEKASSRTVIMITHDGEEADYFGSEILRI